MCFKSDHANNQYVGVNGPLPKSTANNKGLSFESVLSDIYNFGKSGFDRLASMELGLWEAEKLAELRETESRAALQKTQSYSDSYSDGNWNNPNKASADNTQLMMIAGVGLALVAVVFLAKEL